MRAVALALALTIPACMDAADKGPEDDVPADGKLDSFARPTDHGPIAFDTLVATTLAPTARYHTFTFALTGPATIHAFTGPSLTGRQITDTVLYLYKQKANGTWGAYIARNDDASDGDLFSSITRSLDAGSYRVLVKGYTASTYGQFSTQVGCTGAGCATTPPACLFGATFGDLLTGTAYRVTNDAELTGPSTLSALDQSRIVLAVRQSAHTDVANVEEAFAAVDGNVIRRVDLYDEAGGRSFTAFEYGAGDNSYGAVFAYGSTTMVSAIHDGDLAGCTAVAQTCALGGDWYTTRTGGAFTVTGTKVVTAASQLSGTDAADALAAIRVAYADATSLASGLTKIDEGKLNVVDLTETATGRAIRGFEYGAGDNSYGAIYVAGTRTLAASIVDGTYYDCALVR